MKRVLLEVCCGSADDVIEAQKAGADRVELNSDLFHGGLTPTLGELIVAKRETGMAAWLRKSPGVTSLRDFQHIHHSPAMLTLGIRTA